MIQLRFTAAVLFVFMACLILSSGCTGQQGETQPPASTLTLPTTRPVTPAPVTPTPVQTVTTMPAATTIVTPVFTPGTVSQSGSAILIQGDVAGYKAAAGNFIDEIRFNVVKAPRAEPVTFEIPNTQVIFTMNGREFGVNYIPISGDVNGNRILEDGETFLVSITLAPPNLIYAGQVFTMTIQNPPQPNVVLAARVPSVFTDDQIVLAKAP
ncbi:MAG TPA: hypothetical protein VMS81_02350 [Methanomicrobiales archaeon]|jgi:hypothetical protein|nr:hypothetical protein [Methanomicrobiales archaeon]